MSGTDARSQLPGSSLGLGLAITVLGPLIGSAVLYLVVVSAQEIWREPDFLGMAWRSALLILMVGWPSGLFPALVSALLWIGLERHIAAKPARVLLAAFIGATSGAILVWPFLNWALGPYAPDRTLIWPAALAGALSLIATARPWRSGPRGGV